MLGHIVFDGFLDEDPQRPLPMLCDHPETTNPSLTDPHVEASTFLGA